MDLWTFGLAMPNWQAGGGAVARRRGMPTTTGAPPALPPREADMTIAVRLRQYLDSQGVDYDTVPHPRTSTSAGLARAAHVPKDQVAKPVVVHHGDGYVLAVVPSTHRVELGTLRDILGERPGLAAETEVARLFDDCEIGAVPPIGAAYGVPVILDESLDRTADVYFEGGDHTTLVHIGRAAFRALTKDARRERFSHPAEDT
jgi:Ala-tRNA(Pro) deacylase